MIRIIAALLPLLLVLPAAAYEKDYIDGISRRLGDPSPEVRRRAAEDANNAGAEAASAVPALVELLTREREAEVRETAVQALGTTGKVSPLAPAALAPLLRADAEPRVRVLAAEALARLGTGADLAVPALLAALGDAAPEVRSAAARALGAYTGQAAVIVPALAASLGDDGTAGSALLALRDFGAAAAPAVPALRRFIAAPASNEYSRRSAVWALTTIGSGAAAAAPDCLALLGHPQAAMRVAAASALLAFGLHGDAAMKALVAALATNLGPADRAAADERRTVVIDAAWTLRRHAPLASGEALVGLAGAAVDPISGDMRRVAAQAFDEVLAALVKAGRFDAIDSLEDASRFLAASPLEPTRVRGRRVAEAAQELRRLRPIGARLLDFVAPALGLVALGGGALLWRRRRRGGPQVFLSYRRQDSAAVCGRLYDHLVAALGAGQVFRDLDSLAPGTPFAQRLREAVARCDAFVVVMGPTWLTQTDAAGRRRIDDPEDLVRQEVEAALAAARPVFPVLVNGASMPPATELPPSMAALTQAQALEIGDRHFAGEARQLVEAIRAARPPRR